MQWLLSEIGRWGVWLKSSAVIGFLALVGQPTAAAAATCQAAGFEAAARINGASLLALSVDALGRPERGWATYAPLIAQEIGSACPFDSSGFAAAVAHWKGAHRLRSDGLVTNDTLAVLKDVWAVRRPFVRLAAKGVCPDPPAPDQLAVARPEESYGGKRIELRAEALAAYRQMARAARQASPAIRADKRNLTIFSGYRSPAYDDARCLREQNCNRVTRAKCSAHRTGAAFDLYVGEAPGFGPDSSADPNRLAQSRTATYRWLVANAAEFGFANYAFEPWHWEWIGEAR